MEREVHVHRVFGVSTKDGETRGYVVLSKRDEDELLEELRARAKAAKAQPMRLESIFKHEYGTLAFFNAEPVGKTTARVEFRQCDTPYMSLLYMFLRFDNTEVSDATAEALGKLTL